MLTVSRLFQLQRIFSCALEFTLISLSFLSSVSVNFPRDTKLVLFENYSFLLNIPVRVVRLKLVQKKVIFELSQQRDDIFRLCSAGIFMNCAE